MNISQFSSYIYQIEKTASRLEMTEILSELFKDLSSQEFSPAVYLLQGNISPKYRPMQFGFAEKMVIRSLSEALNIELSELSRQYKLAGDFGEVVQKIQEHRNVTTSSYSIQNVFEKLVEIATQEGEGSQERKMRLFGELISSVDALSARYLVRIPMGALRLGFSDMTILDALSWMMTGDKSLRKNLQKAYHVFPDLGYIGKVLKEKGLSEVLTIKPEVFTPIIMMRAERISSPDEIIEKIGPCIVESKYDGFRLQIHKNGNKVVLFTRSLEDVTYMYPDIVQGVLSEITSEKIIFEGEAIGYNLDTSSFLPFQMTVQRKRKYDIEEKAKEIPLKLFAFDMLFLDGKNFIHIPFFERKTVLKEQIRNSSNPQKDTILIAEETNVTKGEEIDVLFDQAISKGLEGIMAKKTDGFYQPGTRDWGWIKFKKSYSSKVNDTIDCVVMGYDFGKGKRSSFGIGAFLVGVFDIDQDKFFTIAKIGTGLTDEEWKKLLSLIQPQVQSKKPSEYNVDNLMECDVWVSPKIVVEIRADEITRSPVHTAGRIMRRTKSGIAFEVEEPGYALRFPRLEHFRLDKNPQEVTTVKELKKIS